MPQQENGQAATISIHALLAESDIAHLVHTRNFGHFISIHALLAESDPLKNAITAVPQQISIHALLAESDVGRGPDAPLIRQFLSTLSLRRATAHLQKYKYE